MITRAIAGRTDQRQRLDAARQQQRRIENVSTRVDRILEIQADLIRREERWQTAGEDRRQQPR